MTEPTVPILWFRGTSSLLLDGVASMPCWDESLSEVSRLGKFVGDWHQYVRRWEQRDEVASGTLSKPKEPAALIKPILDSEARCQAQRSGCHSGARVKLKRSCKRDYKPKTESKSIQKQSLLALIYYFPPFRISQPMTSSHLLTCTTSIRPPPVRSAHASGMDFRLANNPPAVDDVEEVSFMSWTLRFGRSARDTHHQESTQGCRDRC